MGYGRPAPDPHAPQPDARPLGSYEKAAIETAHKYEPMILARYGPEQGAVLIANAKLDAGGNEEVSIRARSVSE